jgi:hypothetical protein
MLKPFTTEGAEERRGKRIAKIASIASIAKK